MNTIHFVEVSFTLSTRVNEGTDKVDTVVTLTESDVPVDTVRDSAISGQSPRVRFQNSWRSNGIPKTVKMSWLEWFGKPQATVQVPMTNEQILDKAKNDPELLKRLLELANQK